MLVAGTATPRPESWLELPRLELPRRVDGRRDAAGRACVDMREADPRSGPLHAETWEAPRAGPRRRRQGDRADQPPRLRPLADLPLLRAPLGLPQLRRLADRPPRQRPPRLPPLRPRRAGCRAPARSAARPRSPAPAPAPSGSRRCWPSGWRRCRSSGSTPTPPPGAAPTPRILAASARRRRGVLVGTQMVAKGHDFPEVTLARDPRRRRDPALPRLPRRGADLRAGHPARRAQRPRRGRGRGDRADARARARRASSTPPATTPPASSPGSSSAAGRSATRPSPT